MKSFVNRLLLLLLSALLLATACRHNVKTATAPPPSAAAPAGTFQSPSGKIHQRTPVGAPDNDEPLNIPLASPSGDNYRGHARMAAKLSIVSGTPESFPSIAELLDSLPSDEDMRALHIDEGPTSDRVLQEQKLVTVKGFLYASSKESDNDFHCIVGSDLSQPPRFMNVEVSGLPPASSPSFAQIAAARNQFKTFFTASPDALPTSRYERYSPPIPVTITGSLFFDVDHVPPAVGPTGLQPQTAWEIHPVSDIQFEP